jgi:cystathionine gamma-lyase
VYNRLAPPGLIDESGIRGSLVIPLDKEAPEFWELITAAVRDLSAGAGGDLWRRLIEPRLVAEAVDQFQFRKEVAAPAGLIPWKLGEDLVRSARLTLASGAKTQVEKMRRFSNRLGQFSGRFLDSVLMGQTAVGSYIVTAYAPTDTAIPVHSSAPAGAGAAGGRTARGRDITIAVANAVEATAEAPDHFHRTASLSAFEANVSRGVSVELSTALQELARDADESEAMPGEPEGNDLAWRIVLALRRWGRYAPKRGGTVDGDGTRSVRAGLPDAVPGQPFLNGPVFASIYHLDPVAGPATGLDGYGRPDNPTRRALERAIGELEGGECVAFAAGMAAVSAALLALTGAGDTVLVPADGYYKTRAFAAESLPSRGISVLTAPTAGPYPEFSGLRLAILESPANPGLDVCDIAGLSAQLHEAGALVAVDNSTATPLGQRPLELGADLVVASATKGLTGHGDVLLGYVCARSPELAARIRAWRDTTGGIPGAFECWLAHRSLATLDIRLARQEANAAAVAELLAARADVVSVRWPGLASHPAHELAARQMRRMPGVVTFVLESRARVETFLNASRLVAAATSFGGVHTTADRRAQWGDDTPDGLVRLSCGIEDTADLVKDIAAALDLAGV